MIEGSERHIEVHDGILAACPDLDGKILVTSGEDGKVCRTAGDGIVETVHHAAGKWIDKIATGPQGAIAFGSGRNGAVILASGEVPCKRL